MGGTIKSPGSGDLFGNSRIKKSDNDLNRAEPNKTEQDSGSLPNDRFISGSLPGDPKIINLKDMQSAIKTTGRKPEEQGVEKDLLVLTYSAGDNNLQNHMIKSVIGQSNVGSDKNMDIIAMIDIGPGGQNSGKEMIDEGQPGVRSEPPIPLNGDSNWEGGKTLYLEKNNNQNELNAKILKDNGPNANMSNPETLKNFIVDSVKNNPAKTVALVASDHGSGHHGTLQDDSDNDGKMMSLKDFKKAVKEAGEETGKKIDVLGFNCGKMSETEVVYELKDQAKFLVGSEESE